MLKRQKLISIVLLFIALVTILLFFFQFNSGFSDEQSDWGSFGSYIGGVLGPIFAFLAFLAGLENLRFIKAQQLNTETLTAIRLYEKDLKDLYKMVVTCKSPWIWGYDLNAFDKLDAIPLRTLLEGDSIDWSFHLAELRESLVFRAQPNGDLFQDRDIWLMTYNAARGLFKYLELYKKQGGDLSIIEYYTDTYEIPYNRLVESALTQR